MSAHADFAFAVDRAAGLLVDATCSTRAIAAGPLPERQRDLVRTAIVAIEAAQQLLYEARQESWPQPPAPKQLQLTT